MKSRVHAFLAAVSFCVLQDSSGQGFINLSFENTQITTVVFPGGNQYTATLPGWTWSPHVNFVNGDPNSVPLNDIALDDSDVTLQGTNSPFAPAIQGNYSLLLQGGTIASESGHGAFIEQTGQVPLTAKSIIYFGDALQVTFNGHSLSFADIGNAPNYSI
jgi:hypothetical protein